MFSGMAYAPVLAHASTSPTRAALDIHRFIIVPPPSILECACNVRTIQKTFCFQGLILNYATLVNIPDTTKGSGKQVVRRNERRVIGKVNRLLGVIDAVGNGPVVRMTAWIQL